MLSLIAGLVLGQASFQRISLPNGASILVDRTSKQALATIHLFASARFAPDSPLTHGYRHLLEHLIARGEDGHVDAPLEAVGGLLTARTFRDVTEIDVTVTPDHLSEGLAALHDVLAKTHFTQAEIDRETRTIAEEAALSDDTSILVNAGWLAAYGGQGLDPTGNINIIGKATPEDMSALQDAIFRGPSVCMMLIGDIPADAVDRAAKLLDKLQPGDLSPEVRGAGKSGRAEAAALGEARCVPVPPFDRPSTAAAVAAGLALAAQMDDCFVVYTPTMQRGLVALGRVGQNSGIALYIDSLKRNGIEPLYGIGKRLAARWYANQFGNGTSMTGSRAMLISEDPSADPSQFLTQLNAMSMEDFVEAARKFGSQNAVTVVGVGR